MSPVRATTVTEPRGDAPRRSFLDLDRAIVFSVLNTMRGMVGGPVIALLIAWHFTPVVQGFYYTFSSVLALQVFAELGLSAVLLQFASHEWAGLSYDEHGVHGPAENISRLADLVRLAARWYGVAGVVASAGLMIGGFYFFRRHNDAAIDWALPWVSLCAITGVKLFLSPFFSILEGCGQVKQVYGYRLAEGVLALVIAVGAISAGAGLWTAVAVAVGVVLANAAFLVGRYGGFYRSLLSREMGGRIRWREEVLPMQWRIAVSWICGYFVFQLFTPVLFNYQGPVIAGQFGLAWSLVAAVSGIATAWINTKVPQFGALIARREFAALDRLAGRATIGAVAVATVASLGAIGVLRGLELWYPDLARRFLPLGPCAVLLASVVLMQVSYAQSSYLRAHKREPFLWLSLAAAILTGGATWYFGSRHGVIEMTRAYLAVVALFTLPVGTIIFVRCRAHWHA